MKKLLIAVDLQRDFIDGALGTKEACAIVEAAARKIRAFEGRVFVTLDTHEENYRETAEGKKLPVPHCLKGTPGHALHPAIAEALQGKDVVVLEKPTFGSVKLVEAVRAFAGEEAFEAEFIGLCTDICVVSNALLLKAYFPEAELSVDAACCAGVTPALHEAALQTMQSCQITVKR